MILRIFLCTLGWSIKMAKNWDTKSLSVEYHFKPLLRDTRLTRPTSFKEPGISEMKRSTFHCSTFSIFFKYGDKPKQIQRSKQLLKAKDVICRIKYGRSKLILLEFVKQIQCAERIVNIISIPGFLKTGLGKISTHSTSWQLKTIKFVQRPIKSVYLTPGSKLMVPRSIPTSPNLK